MFYGEISEIDCEAGILTLTVVTINRDQVTHEYLKPVCMGMGGRQDGNTLLSCTSL